MSVSFFLPCHPQVLPHLRSSRPTAPNQGRRGGGGGACQPAHSRSAELEIVVHCWEGKARGHVCVRDFVLESTQRGWGQQPAFYHRMGKSVI